MKDRKLSIRISEADLIKIHAKAAKSKLKSAEISISLPRLPTWEE